jgi:predicted DsbA family dithiol-disulfide isomerase
MAPALTIREYTDPACPFAFSAEPARLRLNWLYGDQLEWRPVMVVLSESPEDYTRKGLTTGMLASGMADIQRKYGMPIDPRERPRMVATVHACRAVVAARLHAPPGSEYALLRRLRIRAMAGDLIDDPGVIARCAREANIDPMLVFRAAADDPGVEAALRADMAASRGPSAPSLALDHKLASAGDLGRRYTCPSYEISRAGGSGSGSSGWPRFDVPGFQPVEVYEAAIANLAPELERRAAPSSVSEVLEWAGEPLATVEVAAICGIEPAEARTQLARVAHEDAVGPDGFWALPAGAARVAA